MRRTATRVAVGLTVMACGGEGAGTADSARAPDSGTATSAVVDTAGAAASATASMQDAAGRQLGTLTLTESAQGIVLAGRLMGLVPGERAIHLHTTGRCEPPFESAGGHWNPTNRAHGTANPQGPHAGDAPNVTVAADSSLVVQVTTPSGTLRGTMPLLDGDGAAVVIHAGPDDYRTDPSGNSGDRIACAVVTSR